MPDFLRSHGPKVAIGGLVVINVALVTALITRQPAQTAVPAGAASPTAVTATSSSPPMTASSVPTATPSTASPTASASGSPTSSRSPGGQSSTEAERSTRLLAVATSKIIWRAEVGGCDGQSIMQLSSNSGRSWRRVDTGLRSIVRLKTYDTDSVFAVGADADCRPAFVRVSGPDQQAFRDDGQLASTWFPLPMRPNVVHAPGGRTSAPCGNGLADLAGLGTYRAAVLCADGRVRTIDQGRSWKTVRSEPGVLALNADDEQFAAVSRRSDCTGLVSHRFDADGVGLSERSGRCQRGQSEPPVAISIRSDLTALWRADSVTTQ